jgi:hypothetical protein
MAQQGDIFTNLAAQLFELDAMVTAVDTSCMGTR